MMKKVSQNVYLYNSDVKETFSECWSVIDLQLLTCFNGCPSENGGGQLARLHVEATVRPEMFFGNQLKSGDFLYNSFCPVNLIRPLLKWSETGLKLPVPRSWPWCRSLVFHVFGVGKIAPSWVLVHYQNSQAWVQFQTRPQVAEGLGPIKIFILSSRLKSRCNDKTN